MTQAEWLAATDPFELLDSVEDDTTERKTRLFADGEPGLRGTCAKPWRVTCGVTHFPRDAVRLVPPLVESGSAPKLAAVGRYWYAIPAIWMGYDPATKRIVARPAKSTPVDTARQRFTAARSTDALAKEWEAVPTDLRSQLVADKERRKEELAPA